MIRGSYPRRVHNQDGVHYFYWNWDCYKPFDYEPIKVHDNSRSKIVLSRFHWHVATVWTAPRKEDSKPNVAFTKAVHTPIVESESYDCRYAEIEPNIPLKEQIEIVALYFPIFLKLLKTTKFGKKRSYENIIREGGVPQRYLFDLSQIKCAIIIGNFPKPNDLPSVLRDKLWPP